MGPKQQQLDFAIQKIFENISHFDSIENRNTLLVVTGDHGMTDAGNHGGSSPPELSTALLLASPFFHVPLASTQNIQPEVVQQVDIVPTLSILFGAEIPAGSIGVAIQSILEISFLQDSDKTPDFSAIRTRLFDHVIQIVRLMEKLSGGDFNKVKEFLGFQPENDDDDLESIIRRLDLTHLKAILHRSQGYLMTHFSGYNMSKMILGLTFMSIASISFFFQAFKQSERNFVQKKSLKHGEIILVLAFGILQILSFSSTSFIEEEHQAWFFLGTSSFLFFAFMAPTYHQKFLYILASFFVRILRGWTHNGQQSTVTNGGSFSRFLIRKAPLCHVLDPIGIYYLKHSLSSTKFFGRENQDRNLTYSSIGFIFVLSAGFLSFTPMNRSYFYLEQEWIFLSFFKSINILNLIFFDQGFRARLMYYLLGCGLCLSFIFNNNLVNSRSNLSGYKKFKLLRDLKISILILLRSLTKLENYVVLWISLFSSDLIQELLHDSFFDKILTKVDDTKNNLSTQKIGSFGDVDFCLMYTWIEMVFLKTTFFALGGSNSLATLDLSNSFNGLKSFSLPIVVILTFISNFSGPILIGLSNFLNHQNYHLIKKIQTLRFCFLSSSLLFICCLSCFFLNHLFIFTVFSPAVLYSYAWFFGLNLILSLFEYFV